MEIPESLKHKIGPLPVYAWGAIGALGFAGFLFLTRGPSRSTASPDAAGGNNSQLPSGQSGVPGDQSGNLAAVNAELEDLQRRISDTGTYYGAGTVTNGPNGITSAGLSAGEVIHSWANIAETQNYQSVGAADTAMEKAFSAGASPQDIYQTTYENAANVTARTEGQIDWIRAQVAQVTPNLSQADAAHVQEVADQQIYNLRNFQGQVSHSWNLRGQSATGTVTGPGRNIAPITYG